MKNMTSKLIFAVCVFIFMCFVSFAYDVFAEDSISGSLIGKPTYDRIFSGDVDPNCNASSTLSGIGVDLSYEVIVIYSTVGENLVAATNLSGTDISDPVFSLYCDPFDPSDATQNLIAYDDDDGEGLLCAFDGSEGAFMSTGNRYFLVLSLFAPEAIGGGSYQIDLGGDIKVAPVLTVAKDGTGSGSLVSSPAGIDCGADCLEGYLPDENIILSAVADPGSAFDGWSGGGCSGNGGCTVVLTDEDIVITATFNPDSDNDGVSDIIENAGPGGGDGNGDGTADSQQSNVSTFQNIYGDFVTLIAETGTELTDVITTMDLPDANVPDWASFPVGLFGFRITGLSPGQMTTLLIILHEKNEDISTYYKYGATTDNHAEHWYEFSYFGGIGAVISQQDAGTEIILHFIDGQTGDDDLSENGEINDVGGPKVQEKEEGARGNNKPCFIATAVYGSPMDKDVKLLREFRDSFLLTNTAGKAFVDLYYKYSPPVAEFISRHDTMRAVVRYSLLPLVSASRFIKQD